MASFGAPAPAPTLSLEQTRAALKEVDALLADAAVLAQITAVKTAAGPDAMMAMMLLAPLLAKPAAAPAQPALLQVMPVVANLLAPILSKYGFAPDQGGLMQFVVGGSRYKDDEEVTALASSMRERVVPPEMMPMLSAMLAVQQQNAGQ